MRESGVCVIGCRKVQEGSELTRKEEEPRPKVSRGARRGPFRSAKEAIGAWAAARGHTMTGLLELWMARVFVGGRLGRPADHTRLIIRNAAFEAP